MTPKMKATLDEEVHEAARKLFLSSSVADLCKNEATPKQEEFLLHVFQAELAAREENKRHRLMKRAGFPTYKTFEGYEYSNIQFPPLFSREELENCQFIREHKNLILYGPVGTGKTHLAIAIGVSLPDGPEDEILLRDRAGPEAGRDPQAGHTRETGEGPAEAGPPDPR